MAIPFRRKKLGEVLLESGLITEKDLQECVLTQKHRKKRLGEIVVEKGLCTPEQIAMALSSQLGIDYINLKTAHIEPEAVQIIPEKWARKHQVIALSILESTLQVAMVDPLDYLALQDTEFTSGYRIKPFITTTADISWALGKHYNLSASVSEIIQQAGTNEAVTVLNEYFDEQIDVRDIRQQSEQAPIIRIVNHILTRAVEQRASDIHVEPMKEGVNVRIRVDGALRILMALPKWAQGPVTSRIKIMGKMDIAEKRLPQDGRIGIKVKENKLDLRVSTMPSSYGEKVVIRILDPKNSLVSVEQLGLDQKNLKILSSLVGRPQGIILVTGPTGSGKTTSLYAMIQKTKSVEKNIITIEDPVEYDLEDITQVSVDEKVGRTFSGLLRTVLRQDPDVILVGEMRDLDTAMVAMQASLTGHLVLSTIHTNDAVSTITRLRNLGIPSYLIASTVSGILAQRLVRRICPFCKADDSPSPDDLLRIGFKDGQNPSSAFFRGSGCEECGGTGYRGRTGIYELLHISQRIRDHIASEASETTIRQLALAEGMTTLTYSGLEKALGGIVSVDGVLRVTQTDDARDAICADCGNPISTEFIVCPHCRYELIRTCEACKRIVDPGWSFCPYCKETLPQASAARNRLSVALPRESA